MVLGDAPQQGSKRLRYSSSLGGFAFGICIPLCHEFTRCFLCVQPVIGEFGDSIAWRIEVSRGNNGY